MSTLGDEVSQICQNDTRMERAQRTRELKNVIHVNSEGGRGVTQFVFEKSVKEKFVIILT